MEGKELVLEVINYILKKKGREELRDFNEDLHLQNDLGLDSLDLAELTVRIEDKTGVDVFAKRIVTTVGEILEELGAN